MRYQADQFSSSRVATSEPTVAKLDTIHSKLGLLPSANGLFFTCGSGCSCSLYEPAPFLQRAE